MVLVSYLLLRRLLLLDCWRLDVYPVNLGLLVVVDVWVVLRADGLIVWWLLNELGCLVLGLSLDFVEVAFFLIFVTILAFLQDHDGDCSNNSDGNNAASDSDNHGLFGGAFRDVESLRCYLGLVNNRLIDACANFGICTISTGVSKGSAGRGCRSRTRACDRNGSRT